MKSTYLLFISLSIFSIGFTSCRKYVEVEQYNRRELKYTTDYEYLLNNNDIFGATFSLPVLTADELVFTNEAYQAIQTESVSWPYTWSNQFVVDDLEDSGWKNAYQQIYTANVVIEGVLESESGTDQQKKALLAEAKVQRAYNHFLLVNLYGAIYNPSSAAEDLGVPMLLEPDLYRSLERSTVAQVYTQIRKDLEEALVDIPVIATNKRHPNKAAVEGLLAIMFLHMRNFDDALAHADKALSYNSTLLDLQVYAASVSGYPRPFEHPETYFSKILTQNYAEQLNPELLGLFDANDLRLSVYTKKATSSQMPSDAILSIKSEVLQTQYKGADGGPSVPEMLLIKAEVEARKGNIGDAMTALNTLRKKRFKDAEYIGLTAVSSTDALQKVVEERRREFFITGRRWLDMRRFNLDSNLAKEYKRTFKNVDYVLGVGSNKYIYPVANKYLQFNPEIGQRPD